MSATPETDDRRPKLNPLASGEERGGTLARRVGFVLGLLFAALLLFWPGLPLDASQRRVAAVTAICATYWLTLALPIAATSLLPAALFPLLGVLPAGIVAPLYMHDLIGFECAYRWAPLPARLD